jgi:hypothetical protein
LRGPPEGVSSCDLDVDGVTYRAASGYTRTTDLAGDNLDVESVFSADGITE